MFGQTVHQALAFFFRENGNAVAFFQKAWGEAKHVELNYSQRESWQKLNGIGPMLMEKFVQREATKLTSIRGAEKVFQLNITSLDLPFIGVIDLIADLDGKQTVVDFKTSGSMYDEHEVILSDQLTAYQLAEPNAEQAALCVLIKAKEPKIEWHVSARTGEQLVDFLSKAQIVTQEITAGHFYKRPGRWCAWCDYLSVCTGDRVKTQETLVRIG